MSAKREAFKASQRLVKYLDLAFVSNREAVENSLLLPPGAWAF